MPATKIHFGMIDHSSESCGPSVYVEELDNSNYDAIDTSVGLVQVALGVLSDCNFVRTTMGVELAAGGGTAPATVTAQREIGIRVGYRDTVTGRMESFVVPGPATTFYPATGTDVIPLDNVVAAAFIAVFEANCVSQDGNPVNVVSMRLVGRSN